MTRQQITTRLNENHKVFIDYMNSLSEKDFMYAPKEKWTAGQQLEHILLSVKPLVQVLMLPNFAIKMWFGKSNRQGKTYDELIAKYKSKLQLGGRASGRFVPKPVIFQQRTKLAEAIIQLINKLDKQFNKFSDKDLDEMILPHPLLGKLTLREMMYFTIYHVEHHLEIARRNLTN
jgi:hypothetical protein